MGKDFVEQRIFAPRTAKLSVVLDFELWTRFTIEAARRKEGKGMIVERLITLWLEEMKA